MPKYRVTRVWVVEAASIPDAISKTRNFEHEDVSIVQLEPKVSPKVPRREVELGRFRFKLECEEK